MEGYFRLVYGGRNGGRADCKGSIGQIRRREENYDARLLDGEQINQNDLASADMSASGPKQTFLFLHRERPLSGYTSDAICLELGKCVALLMPRRWCDFVRIYRHF